MALNITTLGWRIFVERADTGAVETVEYLNAGTGINQLFLSRKMAEEVAAELMKTREFKSAVAQFSVVSAEGF